LLSAHAVFAMQVFHGQWGRAKLTFMTQHKQLTWTHFPAGENKRATDAFGSPAEAVNHLKRQRLRVLAGKWLEDFPIRMREIRFDVVSVIGDQVEVIEGAF